jgi:hypothetical protein
VMNYKIKTLGLSFRAAGGRWSPRYRPRGRPRGQTPVFRFS